MTRPSDEIEQDEADNGRRRRRPPPPRKRAAKTEPDVNKREAFGALAKVGTDVARGVVAGRRDAPIAGDAGARRRQLAKLGASIGGTMTAAKLGSIGRSQEQKAEVRRQAADKATAKVVESLGNMKGLAMKFGQLLSFAATLSDEAEKQLAALQVKSEPIPYDAVAHVITEELGAPPEELFASFSREPIAAASIGQVHRARLHDGRDVVVKLQYPGIEDAILADLETIEDLTAAMSLSGGQLQFHGVYDEIATLVREELDYVAEAANQQEFAERYRDHPHVLVPEVVTELSTAAVLTSAFVDGRILYDIQDRPEAVRDRYGEIIYRFAFGCVFDGAFSGDPHPGNYLFLEDGRVCFLDFGLVKRLESDEVAAIRALASAARDGDGNRIEKALAGLHLEAGDADVDIDDLWDEIGPITFGPLTEGGPHRLSREEYRRQLKLSQGPTSEMFALTAEKQLPTWVSVFLRYAFGTTAVLSLLGAELDWPAILAELADGASPTTPIGKAWAKHQATSTEPKR